MSETNKSYRIRTNVQGEDHVDINLALNQDIQVFEMLSLKISSENLYKLHSADYGCVAGRVLANGGVGIPNAKLSIFIEADAETQADAVLSYLYPYKNTFEKDSNGVRYNLLTEEKLSTCHQNVGTFPPKRLVLDDDNVLEIFDKYYKFTTTTNASGDYMIFGVPTGSQTLHMDLDISDIGELLSQRPRDLKYKGYNDTLFENANMFKGGDSIDGLAQIFTQTENVFVYPFWGEKSEMGELNSNGVRITRKDIDINYKFEPTCVFIGSLVTDEKSNGFTKKCIPTERMGKMDRLTTGEGTIEMIRKKTDGSVESYTIQGNQLIDGNGTWCYQIPMNLDYVMTDEYGNIVPTDNPEKGVPTRTRVRFRVSLSDYNTEIENSHLVKVLIPNNPNSAVTSDKEIDYAFGSATDDDDNGSASFRDLFYNNVYTVKSYIPRLQYRNFNKERRFSGIKAVNVNVGNNPIPYNNMRIDITFLFTLQCAIMHTLIWFTKVFNTVISLVYKAAKYMSCCTNAMKGLFTSLKGCLTIGDGMCPDLEEWYFAPGCSNVWYWGEVFDENPKRGGAQERNPMEDTLAFKKGDVDYTGLDDFRTLKDSDSDTESVEAKNANEETENVCITNKIEHFLQCVEIALAQEYEVIQFDFYNDWINGLLYIPRWFAKIRKKRTFLFGLIKSPEKLQACVEDNVKQKRKYVQQCALEYSKEENGKYTNLVTTIGCNKGNNHAVYRCHKKGGRKFFEIRGGYVRPESTSRGQTVYYFKPCTFENSKHVNLFATDIVLLGSLSDHNYYGIPQSFKSLVSSTYQMPTNIAATNLGHVGYMYQGGTDEYLCQDGTLKGVKHNEENDTYYDDDIVKISGNKQTFENEEKWQNGLNYDEEYITGKSEEYYEYAVTEASGIDWGYTGPGQAYRSNSETRRQTVYLPGGHFLGISCAVSEANIKSCINLSRVCEIGVTFSQRQYIPTKSPDGNDLGYISATIPTGIISKDEISDNSFREEFATLNFNGLRTIKDPSTQRRVYDFEVLNPRNFDGAFKQIVTEYEDSGYEDLDGRLEEDGKTKAYKRTNENASRDYYDFRIGCHNCKDSELRAKYLINNGNSVALPMYENSFYFYFGLKDGSTALDRFYKEFFAQCPDPDPVAPHIMINGRTADPCALNDEATIEVTFVGFTQDKVYLKFLNADGTVACDVFEVNITGNITTIKSKDEHNLLKFGGGDYTAVVCADGNCDDVILEKNFSVVTEIDKMFKKINISSYDFKKEKVTTTVEPGTDGYITFDFSEVNVLEATISDGNKTVSLFPNPDQTYVVGNKCYVWSGNTEYFVMAKIGIQCGQRIKEVNREAWRGVIGMPVDMNLQLGPVNGTHGTDISNLTTDKWWAYLINDDTKRWSVWKALAYTTPYSTYSAGKIDVYPINGVIPYTEDIIKGGGEKTVDGVVMVENGDKSAVEEGGYYLTLNGFNRPTLNITGTSKINYVVNFSDSSLPEPKTFDNVLLPSVYWPFYMEYVAYRPMFGNNAFMCRCSLQVYNGIPYDEKPLKSLYVVGIGNVNTSNPYDEFMDYLSVWQSMNNNGHMDCVADSREWVWSNRQNRPYHVNAVENAPDGYEGDALLINETVSIPSKNIADKSYDGVRFFKMYRYRVNGSSKTRASSSTPISEASFNSITFVRHTPRNTSQIYYQGSYVSFMIPDVTESGCYFVFDPKEQIDKNAILNGDLSEIKTNQNAAENENSYKMVIAAIYDPWTRLDDLSYRMSWMIHGTERAFVGENETKFSLIAIYTVDDFIENVLGDGDHYDYYQYPINDDICTFETVSHSAEEMGTDSFWHIGRLCDFTLQRGQHAIVPDISVEMSTSPETTISNCEVTLIYADRALFDSHSESTEENGLYLLENELTSPIVFENVPNGTDEFDSDNIGYIYNRYREANLTLGVVVHVVNNVSYIEAPNITVRTRPSNIRNVEVNGEPVPRPY